MNHFDISTTQIVMVDDANLGQIEQPIISQDDQWEANQGVDEIITDEQNDQQNKDNNMGQTELQAANVDSPPKGSQISPKKKRNGPKLTINIFNTQYDVIQLAAKEINMRIRQVDPNLYINPYLQMDHYSPAPQPEEFDICWFDLAIQADVLYRLKPYQRISQWPGICVIAHKNKLGKGLMLMKREFPEDYDFFPETYLLPYELADLKKCYGNSNEDDKDNVAQATNRKKVNKKSSQPAIEGTPKVEKEPPIFIIKPECQSQGKGIWLTRRWEDVPAHDHVVAQQYIDKPYLIDSLKFDLRIYVLLYGINPLKIYVFEDGLARFATTPYQSPDQSNLNDMFMHLTNYAINKNAANYKQNETEEGTGKSHKRSLKQIYKALEQRGHNVVKIQEQIDDLIIKTMITGQPSLWHIFRSCQPEDVENQLCFQILGFDVMIDEQLKPWLIEVNHAPSLATESAFDLQVKKKLVEDTIRILNLSVRRKQQYINQQKVQFQKRILTGKTQKLSNEEKEIKRKEIDQQRQIAEENLKGGYRMIYPLPETEENTVKSQKYQKMLDTSKELYEYYNSAKKQRDGGNLKSMRDQDQKEKDSRPPWRSTGAGNMPNWDKPSKYQANSNIKAKVYTGLTERQPDKDKQQDQNEGNNHQNIQQILAAAANSIVAAQSGDGPFLLNGEELMFDENGDLVLPNFGNGLGFNLDNNGANAVGSLNGSVPQSPKNNLFGRTGNQSINSIMNITSGALHAKNDKRTLYQHMIVNCSKDQKEPLSGAKINIINGGPNTNPANYIDYLQNNDYLQSSVLASGLSNLNIQNGNGGSTSLNVHLSPKGNHRMNSNNQNSCNSSGANGVKMTIPSYRQAENSKYQLTMNIPVLNSDQNITNSFNQSYYNKFNQLNIGIQGLNQQQNPNVQGNLTGITGITGTGYHNIDQQHKNNNFPHFYDRKRMPLLTQNLSALPGISGSAAQQIMNGGPMPKTNIAGMQQQHANIKSNFGINSVGQHPHFGENVKMSYIQNNQEEFERMKKGSSRSNHRGYVTESRKGPQFGTEQFKQNMQSLNNNSRHAVSQRPPQHIDQQIISMKHDQQMNQNYQQQQQQNREENSNFFVNNQPYKNIVTTPGYTNGSGHKSNFHMTQPIMGTGSALNREKLNIPSPPSTKSGSIQQSNINLIRPSIHLRGNPPLTTNTISQLADAANKKQVVVIQNNVQNNNRLEISKDGIFVQNHMGINKIGQNDQQQVKTQAAKNQIYELSTQENHHHQNTSSTTATGSGKSMGPTRNEKILESATRSYRAQKGTTSNMRAESKSQTQRNGAGSKFVDYNAPVLSGNFFQKANQKADREKYGTGNKPFSHNMQSIGQLVDLKPINKEKNAVQSNPTHFRERLSTQDQATLNKFTKDDVQFTAPMIQSYSHEKKVEKEPAAVPPNTVPVNSDTKMKFYQLQEQRGLYAQNVLQSAGGNPFDVLRQIEVSQEMIYHQLTQMQRIEQRYHNTPIINKNFQNQIIAQHLMGQSQKDPQTAEKSEELQGRTNKSYHQKGASDSQVQKSLEQYEEQIQNQLIGLNNRITQHPQRLNQQIVQQEAIGAQKRNSNLMNQNAFRLRRQRQAIVSGSQAPNIQQNAVTAFNGATKNQGGIGLQRDVNNQGLYILKSEMNQMQRSHDPSYQPGENNGRRQPDPNTQLGINTMNTQKQVGRQSSHIVDPKHHASPERRNDNGVAPFAPKGQKLHNPQRVIFDKQQQHQQSLGINLKTVALKPANGSSISNNNISHLSAQKRSIQ